MITDFIYNDTLQLKDGDFLLEESEQYHISDIMEANKGEYRQYPLIGVGAANFLNSPTPLDEIRKRISVQLVYDNFKVEEISRLKSGEILIVARQNEKI